MAQLIATPETGRRTSSLPLALLKVGDVLERDIYILYQGSIILFRSEGQRWTADDRDKLSGFGVDTIYVSFSTIEESREFLDRRMSKTILDEALPVEMRAKLLYESSQEAVESLYASPLKAEFVQRAVAYVKHTLNFLAADRKNFVELLGHAANSYSEFTHAIHVAAYAITVAKRIGYVNPVELTALGLGAMLHDVGKFKIDRRILEKRTPLDEYEKRELRKHVPYGVEIVKKHANLLPPLVEVLVLEHHERPDGSGYPHGKKELTVFSKILAMVDCFDAMTSERPFLAEIKTVDALKLMMTELKPKYDSALLLHLIKALQI